MLTCPVCQQGLTEDADIAITCPCGLVYPRLTSGGIDFLRGEEFKDFDWNPVDTAQQEMLEQEAVGIAWRIESFIIPLFGRFSRATKRDPRKLAVLDCGCGSGLSVDILNAHGIPAFGIDAGEARHRQWDVRSFSNRLHSANALHLPFGTGSFDVVFSSGLIEHIGIHEQEAGTYRARRLPDCHAQRQQFVRELVRVLKPEGFILLDHPNGGSPADFWHGGAPGSIRWHALRGDMLPRFAEISGYFRTADRSLRLYSLSPRHRLQFNKVRNHWYGNAFAPLMKIWFRMIEIRALSFLARGFLNPYLVTVASRQPDVGAWLQK
jgi:SAM-dependent methyltransferase